MFDWRDSKQELGVSKMVIHNPKPGMSVTSHAKGLSSTRLERLKPIGFLPELLTYSFEKFGYS